MNSRHPAGVPPIERHKRRAAAARANLAVAEGLSRFLGCRRKVAKRLLPAEL